MKKYVALLCVCMMGAGVVQAETIISASDDALNNNNGGFELDLSGATVADPDNKANNDLLDWTGTPSSGPQNGSTVIGKTTWNSGNSALVSEGISSAVIGGNDQGLFLDTGYEVAEGDIFTLNLDWIPAGNWDAADVVEVFLYTTDGAANTVVYSTDLTGLSDGASMQNLGPVNSTAVAANVGQNLLMEVNFSADGGEWARLDNVELSVIPEPAAMGMISLIAFAALFIRRRFMM